MGHVMSSQGHMNCMCMYIHAWFIYCIIVKKYVCTRTHTRMYLRIGVKEAPPTTVKEVLGVVVDRLQDLGPVQALDTLSILDVT